ncbi:MULTISPECIES: cation:proton antiporter [unclassified Candidatus Frackibacter]|uniref:cation:proton antiporter n=1 Tax=unclassified Candidatus Frackibacter TaxID=2648818 RepID=UPI00079BEAF5|nr:MULTISPECIES: cation:proton antiporter [unclassified Candidatus Frackibacter]KXS45129.1 MAG: sodium/hydrogen exchanger [Candidatus Frackibacter sp. T328-2]SDC47553.1 Kef-type K+ transport system, membrane component KefB [Candidatus Frackibacter sp. WG11]SEM81165.1 Kef-type K+ transport system, membrane component KefB [Candidatus Frackibacter sp. WG12]SFL72881.1 Kef-type K+ transport system, membrane component KefB [Candidatus Frackibacter sp. WG13]
MEVNLILILGVILLLSLALGRLANKLKLPAVPGYLIAGLLLGPSISKVMSHEMVKQLHPINGIALGIIALVIGGELSLESVKKLGKAVIFMGLFEVLGAIAVVTVVMMFFLHQFALSLLLGGLAAATAPAATVAVIKESKASGPLTNSLLGIVALDDVFGVISFGIISAIVKTMASGSANTSILTMIKTPMIEIVGSIILGSIMGYILSYFSNRMNSEKSLLALVLGSVFLASGLATLFEFSPILTNMVSGVMVRNISSRYKKVFDVTEGIEVPIFIVFFALAGARFELHRLVEIGGIGLAYALARVAGKMLGVRIGGELGGASSQVKKYLGMGLMPQAGVAVGLVIIAQQAYPQASNLILNILLTSVMISALFGPILSKIALVKAGEVGALEQGQDCRKTA